MMKHNESSYHLFVQESSHFGFYALNQTETVVDVKDSDLFIEDWIGLQKLSSENKLHFLFSEGDHMNFDKDWFVDNIVTKFLL